MRIRTFVEQIAKFECCGEMTDRINDKKRKCSKCDALWNKVDDGWAKISKKKNESLDEGFKVGDTVIAKIGPHKGQKHEIIHKHDDGSFNIKPIGKKAKDIKYRLGATKAKASDLELCEETLDEAVDKEALRKKLDSINRELSRLYGEYKPEIFNGTRSEFIARRSELKNKKEEILKQLKESLDEEIYEKTRQEIIKMTKEGWEVIEGDVESTRAQGYIKLRNGKKEKTVQVKESLNEAKTVQKMSIEHAKEVIKGNEWKAKRATDEETDYYNEKGKKVASLNILPDEKGRVTLILYLD